MSYYYSKIQKLENSKILLMLKNVNKGLEKSIFVEFFESPGLLFQREDSWVTLEISESGEMA